MMDVGNGGHFCKGLAGVEVDRGAKYVLVCNGNCFLCCGEGGMVLSEMMLECCFKLVLVTGI